LKPPAAALREKSSIAAPRDVYESLAKLLGCELAISSEIQNNTLRVEPPGTAKPGQAGAGGSGKTNLMKINVIRSS
jgi:hypothetical protein